jgi:peroxiredoxin
MAFISFACIAAVAFSNTQSGKTCMKSIVASPRALSLDMGLLAKLRGFGREKREVAELVEQIAVGAQLPVVDTEICSADGSYRVASLPEILGVGGINGTSLLIGMPGAFTPTCTKEHLPDIMTNIDSLTSSGVDRVAVMTTNDRFVNMAWRQALEATRPSTRAQYEKLVFLSDADGDAVKALGLAEDMGYGYGVRSKRFAMIIQNGVVKHVSVDEGVDSFKECSAAQTLKVVKKLVKKEKPAAEGGLSTIIEAGNSAQAAGGALIIAALAFTLNGGANPAMLSDSKPASYSPAPIVKKKMEQKAPAKAPIANKMMEQKAPVKAPTANNMVQKAPVHVKAPTAKD